MTTSSIEILYEQEPFLVVSKPAGVLTQAPPGIDSMEVRLKRMLADRDGSDDAYVGVPHRLDRPVSGVMIFAKKRRAIQQLGKQFQLRKVEKIYWAAVAGEVQPEEGTWQDTMWKVRGEARAEIVAADHPEAKEALLSYRVLDRHSWGTWLEIRLETGRTHQIRVQAASRGFPVLGDVQYGSEIAFGEPCEDVRQRSIALHGRSLTFHDWIVKAPSTIVAPLPESWRSLQLDSVDNGDLFGSH